MYGVQRFHAISNFRCQEHHLVPSSTLGLWEWELNYSSATGSIVAGPRYPVKESEVFELAMRWMDTGAFTVTVYFGGGNSEVLSIEDPKVCEFKQMFEYKPRQY